MESFLHQGDLCLWQRGAGSVGERCRMAERPWLVCLWLYPFLAESLLSKGCCRFRVLSFFRVYFSLFSVFPFLFFLFSSFLFSSLFSFSFFFSLFSFFSLFLLFLSLLFSFLSFPFCFFHFLPFSCFFSFLFFVLREMKGIGVPGRGEVRRGGWKGVWVDSDGAEGGDAASLHIAAVERVALQVSAQEVSPRQLHAILVHTPTQPTLPAPGGLALGRYPRAEIRSWPPDPLWSPP